MAKYVLTDIFEGNYPVSQLFGARPSYYQSISGGTLKGHEGVDWATPVGVKLLVPFESGAVLRTGWDGIYGYYVVLWDLKQLCAVWYCHLSEIAAKPGQRLTRGFVVGRTGATGNVSGAHVHVNFCETSEYGWRINTANGYQGFRNMLNSYLVSWKLGR